MVGGQFQGANVANFSSGVVTLFTVASTPPEGTMTVQAVTNATSFRYLALHWTGERKLQCGGSGIRWSLCCHSIRADQSGGTAGHAQVALTWNTPSSATGYKVKRATSAAAVTRTIATGYRDQFTNTGLANGTTYYYVVSAEQPA